VFLAILLFAMVSSVHVWQLERPCISARTAKLLKADQSYAELVPPENIRLAFMLLKQTTEARTQIVMAKGHYYIMPLQKARAFVEYPWNIW